MKLLLFALTIVTVRAAKVDITHLFGEGGTAIINGVEYKCCVNGEGEAKLMEVATSGRAPGCGQMFGEGWHDHTRAGKCEIEDDHLPEGFCGSSGGADSVASRA